ncbi:hypothetical protein WN944_001015 [Citrus x changshan-huyou]|uniref:Leucine-rich repeat-containing N-terminal plant-type domain-containing protein n=1 Tax=Citrus x changshan-huyou TaxID=2935761 RepID=A0AAP0MK82_9ROSI
MAANMSLIPKKTGSHHYVATNFSLDVSSNSTKEAHALVKWKASLQVHSRSLLHSWSLSSVNATKISLCTWSGIHCNHARRAVGINLTSISLNGTLLEFSFSSFPHLAYLDLYNNELFVLHISRNRLNGSTPHEMGQLTFLNHLTLDSIFLDDLIPRSLGNLTNVVFLYLYNNSFSGSIPKEIGNLKSLFDLELSINQLSGAILLGKNQAPRSRSATTTPVRSRSVTTTLVRSRTVTNDLPGYDSGSICT